MKEQLSALIDSELSDAEALRLLKAMKNDPALDDAWASYHWVGDALRQAPQLSPDFGAKLAQRLAQEPTVLAPQRDRPAAVPARNFPLSIAASVAAVSLVSILALQLARINVIGAPAQVATTAPVQQLAQADTSSKAVMPADANRPARVKFTRATPNTYLIAHQEFSPGYAPAYVRVVSEQRENNE
jgi:sigma-E factor negative regulatory protein RseA